MLKAYIDLLSQPSRTLYLFLKYTKIPHTIQVVDMMQGEHRKQEFATINPSKLLPAIEDDGFCLDESVAILQYLSNKHHIDYLYPTDLQRRAKIEGYTHWHHLNLRYAASNTFMALFREPFETGKPVNQTRLNLSLKVLKLSLSKMEDIYLKDTRFLNSDTMSIADLLGVCELMQPQLALGMDFSSNYPKVANWTELVRETVGPSLFDEAHKPISMLKDIFKSTNVPLPKL